MISRAFQRGILWASVVAFGLSGALADTVTTIDNVSVNGTALSLDADELRFSSNTLNKKETYVISRTKLRVLEFNDLTDNLKAPPSPFMAHESKSPQRDGRGAGSNPHRTWAENDTVFLVGGGSRTGHVVSISPSEVKLDDSSVIRKFRVVSIQFAPSP